MIRENLPMKILVLLTCFRNLANEKKIREDFPERRILPVVQSVVFGLLILVLFVLIHPLHHLTILHRLIYVFDNSVQQSKYISWINHVCLSLSLVLYSFHDDECL